MARQWRHIVWIKRRRARYRWLPVPEGAHCKPPVWTQFNSWLVPLNFYARQPAAWLAIFISIFYSNTVLEFRVRGSTLLKHWMSPALPPHIAATANPSSIYCGYRALLYSLCLDFIFLPTYIFITPILFYTNSIIKRRYWPRGQPFAWGSGFNISLCSKSIMG